LVVLKSVSKPNILGLLHKCRKTFTWRCSI